jgi:hypothetical protein
VDPAWSYKYDVAVDGLVGHAHVALKISVASVSFSDLAHHQLQAGTARKDHAEHTSLRSAFLQVSELVKVE